MILTHHLTDDDIDKIIFAKILDKDNDPILYKAVTNYTIHCPYGVSRPTSPCTKDKRCIKHDSKEIQQ